ncbi:hypothetical protein SRHO_G00265960 [Serrasalmus rhombeus]
MTSSQMTRPVYRGPRPVLAQGAGKALTLCVDMISNPGEGTAHPPRRLMCTNKSAAARLSRHEEENPLKSCLKPADADLLRSP